MAVALGLLPGPPAILIESHRPPPTEEARVSSCDAMNGTFWMVPSVAGLEESALRAKQGPGLTELAFWLGRQTPMVCIHLKKIIIIFEKIWEGNKQNEVKERR